MCFISSVVEDLYETVNDREIRQVFEGQNRIHLEIKQLHRQLAMILDEQRRYVSVITDEVGKKGANAESGQVSMSLQREIHTKCTPNNSGCFTFLRFRLISGYFIDLNQVQK